MRFPILFVPFVSLILQAGLPLGAGAEESTPRTADVVLAPQPRPARAALAESRLPLEFMQGERLAFVGGSLGERMNLSGYFETLLHTRFPRKELVVRNFCRPADEVGRRQRPGDYTKLDDPLAVFSADTYLCFFGYNESFAGPGGVEKFKKDYAAFLQDYRQRYTRDDTGAAARFVLVSPAAFEDTGNAFLPDAAAENERIMPYVQAVREVALEQKLAFVDVFRDTFRLFNADPGMQFSTNGSALTPAGDRVVAETLDSTLFGGTAPPVPTEVFENIRSAVNDKSWVHAQDYRMLNGWYVYGGRRTLDTETFPLEILKTRRMTEVRDRYVHDLAQGKPVPAEPDDSKTGDLFVPQTGFGTKPYSEPKELKYLSIEEGIAAMTVPQGYEVQLVASQREWPELADVDQINFDSKGRLWASCMPNYPQWQPGNARPSDRLLIFDDFDAKGKARKMTVFYDKLICPTGFEFWNGGVIVVDEPRLIFLKDTDGDDKADVVIPISDGWATDDTHHTIGAFEWSNGGLLHMLEGVSMSTAVETPWGPVRNSGSPGCYVLDPLTQKVRRFTTPGYGNPWCYVFDSWGQGFVGDGTTPQQHWDSPLSTAPVRGRKGLNTIFDGEGMRPNVGTEFIRTRQFPDDVQGLFIYACVINMHGLTTFTLGDDGAGYKGGRRTRQVGDRDLPYDLLTSTDANFRPVDPMIGPDGALYFGDWHTALLGHMQYSQRDPNRDHSRGALYRMVYKDKPLLTPVLQYGKTVPELLAQLTDYEPRTRYRARRELGARPSAEVVAGVQAWVASLDPAGKEYDRLLCEALWVQQWHHLVDPVLLKKVLRATTGEARAAATRVLADEWALLPGAMELIQPQVTDEFARTRLEAVRALSFIQTPASVETMLKAATLPSDYWLDYTMEMSLMALEPVWKPLLAAGNVARENPRGLELISRLDRLSKPEGVAELELKKLLAGSVKEADRAKSYDIISKAKGDPAKGKIVAQRICVACHMIDGQGINYGPAMAGVATRLKKGELVESIIDPNAKLDPKYVTTNLETNAGLALTGFVTAETDAELTFMLPGGVSQNMKKSDLRKRETLKQSSMPEGLGNTMSGPEFLDLVEYLATLKTP
ncbi:MAG: putative rane-bound dehydrogenase [Verrucomicrobiales bacterium]|nr:putative rane-bound dehydrogenase [Verrucomicrobiales bacterium]